MKKPMIAVALSLFLATGLTGCGGTKAESVESTAVQTEESTKTAETDKAAKTDKADNNHVKLRIMSMTQVENPEGPLEKEIVQGFLDEHPNVEIEWIGVAANDMSKKLSAMAAGDDLPDIISTPVEMLASAKEMNILMDLNQVFPAEFLQDFYPEVLAQSTFDDELLLLPYQGMNAALLYRSDWLKEAGMEEPETWEDFIKVAKAMTKDINGDGQADQWGFAMLGTRNASAESRFLYITRSFGVKELYQDTDGTWKTDVGNDQFKKALQMFCDFSLKDGITAPGVLETGYGEAANLVVAEKAGLLITGSNAVGTIIAQNPGLEGKLASCAIPMETQHVSDSREVGYSISRSCKNVDTAKELLMYLCQDDNLLKWNEDTGRVPTKKSVENSPSLSTPEMKGFMEGTKYFYERPKHAGYVEVQDVLGEAYQSVLSGDATVDEASVKAQSAVEDIIKSYQ